MVQNSLIQKALQITGEKTASPEAIIFSCAKLALMNEVALEACLTTEEIDELKKIRSYFDSTNFDISLIKTGVPVIKLELLEHLCASDVEKYASFKSDILHEPDALTLLKKAVEISVVNFAQIFGQGKGMTDVFNYLDELRNKPHTEGEHDFALDNIESSSSKGEGRNTTVQQTTAAEPAKADPHQTPERVEELVKPQHEPSPQRAPLPQDKQIVEDNATSDDTEGDAIRKLIESDSIATMQSGFLLLQAKLLEEIKGQDQAILKFCRGYFEGEVIYKQRSTHERPKNFFFLFGPPGVGKTMLSKRIAKLMGIRAEIFNMSETSIGNIAGFVNHHPKSIVVLDEIEKAGRGDIMMLLQLLGSGAMNGVDFTQSTIIFTSNVGKELYNDSSININNIPEKVIIDTIANTTVTTPMGEARLFPPEITSRLATGNVIVFNHLAPIHLKEMADAQFESLTQSMSEKFKWNITYPASLSTMFFFVRGTDLDARVVTEQSNKFMLREVYEVSNLINAGTVEDAESQRIDISISLDGATDQIKKLFTNPEKTKVLFFADTALKDSIPFDENRYEIIWTDDVEVALEALNQDIDSVFIDILCNPKEDNTSILSVNDYRTAGVELFYRLTAKILDLNIYVLNRDGQIPKMDRNTLISDGAAKVLPFATDSLESFVKQLDAIINAEYMEKQAKEFSSRGLVLDYKSRQVIDEDKTLHIEFYDLQKKLGIDPKSRGSILTDEDTPDVTFDDVIGAKSAKEALQSYIDYLKNPTAYLLKHPAPAKGLLMYGPAGTGKTMLAKAMANEAKVTFIATNASAFKGVYHGESEERVRKLFAQARQYAPAIIFIDEVESIARPRNGGPFSSSADESTLTEILVQMDGFNLNPKKPVFVIAATNVMGRGDKAGLDQAFLSRFSQKIEVKLPDKDERLAFLKMALAKRHVTSISEEEMDAVATRTVNTGLRTLQNMIDNAITVAERENREVTIGDLMEAREQEAYGEKSSQKYSYEYYDRVAHHEAGHALSMHLHGITPSFICVASRDTFGGYAEYITEGRDPSMNREDCLGRIVSSLAGRAAEEVFYGKEVSVNTGASSDLEHATDMAINMLCSLGMEDGSLFTMSRSEMMASPLASEYIARVNVILAEQYEVALQLIRDNRETIDKIAKYLLEKNEISTPEFLKIVNG